MLRPGNEIRNSVSAFSDLGAVCILTSGCPKTSIMEAPNLLENGNIPQKRKCPCCKVALYTSIFVLIALSVVFCLVLHKQPPETCWAHGFLLNYSTSTNKATMIWEWNLKHCDDLVQQNRKHLIIKKNGNYFIYAQISRQKNVTELFTVELYKEPNISLNKAVGPKAGDEKGMVNFGRPFYLQKGDTLYCEANIGPEAITMGTDTYWGLYKI
ncbi:uncharacterized protein LOC121074220 [Cygnus olor]|uniref:uncharacterized protein LOC121074220 n=1 Tax=Cygnus olor TaxID=8869 RepID=UPI001ADE1F35|nr:uncharacterized protein LOC121074220 [Cygnus olor]